MSAIRSVRRNLFTLALGIAAVLPVATVATGAHAAPAYPSKPIRVIVPFPAGGGTDIIAREVTNKVAMATGWTFVVDNKPGSGGNLGVDAAAKAPADGYTIVLGQTSNLAINPTLFSHLPYDPLKDLAPISLVASAPLVLATPVNSPYKTVADLVQAGKAKPGKLNIASPGNGTVAHLSGELLQKTAGVKFTHVPYKGTAQAVNDLIGGQVDLYFSSVPTLLAHIRNNKVRALAVTSARRVDDLPQVPTIAESGYPGFEAATWFGFVAPAATPKDVIARLNAEFNKALQTPDLAKKLSDQGAVVLGGTPEAFGARIRQDITRWAAIVKESGTKLD
ncbi:Bug family tripartite tricarboxylate transporter substrate binding protein [Cupriavidus agavae]|uniref:Tripartite-type tricarboxylate transporter receptor subunit TctC n=1 Tax=Cupriavidus agavae TaxID=1001822 RepID=A0A4Q7RZG6_9BURK|nr:tripartite tricarboxylate transporter substrate binding protein [Cupriavidus agavae]RZT39243.1 tripartite-type tricarboxylate transporter receptor subunit TctC [Cupriavidus agavae]